VASHTARATGSPSDIARRVAFGRGVGSSVVSDGPEYPGQLRRALAKRRLGQAPLVPIDGETRAMLEQELTSPLRGGELCADRAGIGVRRPGGVVPAALLDHPAPEVRQDALERIERLGVDGAADAIRRRLALEPVSAVRGSALRVLCALEGQAQPSTCHLS